jgi:hypothetical protein
VPAGRPEPTTYSRLTRSATSQLAQVLIALDAARPGDPAPISAALAAHRHLTAMLGHLGSTLRRPLAVPPEVGPRPRRPRGSDDTLARRLTAAGAIRDWSEAAPTDGSPAEGLLAAARLIGAAADLWATHHDPSGAPRSPEAARMRHPATLGAATREWRELVVVAAACADALARSAVGTGAQDEARRHAAALPEPTLTPRAARGPVTITVARPARTRPADPLVAIEAGVRALQLTAWQLARTGTAPIPVLVNLAVVGVHLNRAAAAVGQRAHTGGEGTEDLAGACVRARAAALGWRRAVAALAPLRSAHPATTSVQVERLELQHLLDRVSTGPRPGPDWAAAAEVLIRLSRGYDEVAAHLAEALTAAHAREEVLLDGRRLPNELLSRRPDLLEAKLRGWPVPSPTAPITHAQASLGAVAEPDQYPVAQAGPPAA